MRTLYILLFFFFFLFLVWAPVFMCVETGDTSLTWHPLGTIYLVFLRQDLSLGLGQAEWARLVSDYPASPRDPPVSTSSALGLQVWAATPSSFLFGH